MSSMTKPRKKIPLFWIGTVFVGLLAIPLLILKNPTSLDDGLRHYVYAATLRSEGIFTVPGWSRFLYEGTMSRLHVDPWFLSDVLLIPFTVLPVVRALQLFVLAQAAFLLFSFTLLLRAFNMPRRLMPMYLFFFLFGDHLFLSRLFLARPFPLMTGMFLLTLWAILERRWISLGFILSISVLLSHLFVFPAILCAGSILWLMLQKRNRDAMLLAGSLIAGVAFGFLLHPQAADYAEYLFTIFFRIPFLRELKLGNELGYGYAKGISSSVVALLFAGAMTLAFFRQKNKGRLSGDGWIIILLGTMSLGLMVAQMLWIRVVDFLWPVLLILIAFLHSRPGNLLARTKQYLFPTSMRGHFFADLFVLLTILQTVIVYVVMVRKDPDRRLTTCGAIEAVEPGARLLNPAWAPRPPFLMLRPDLRYATGMDPTFLYAEDPEAFRLMDMFHKGTIGKHEGLSEAVWVDRLLERMPSDVLVLPNGDEKTVEAFSNVPRLRMLSNTGAFAIFRILP